MASTTATETNATRPNFFKRTGLFFKDAWGELKRVRWPNRKELVTYTTVTLVTCIFVILLIIGFDAGINALLHLMGI
ncbi:MAG TPA: preprotein translocase subunit SecE [Bacilli bacterium]|nr:preprotein translocase subunit SecE [Bacilli bacterium]